VDVRPVDGRPARCGSCLVGDDRMRRGTDRDAGVLVSVLIIKHTLRSLRIRHHRLIRGSTVCTDLNRSGGTRGVLQGVTITGRLRTCVIKRSEPHLPTLLQDPGFPVDTPRQPREIVATGLSGFIVNFVPRGACTSVAGDDS
jgi:hypothetical protein